ncbi:PREDICTED: CD48 antigen [Miniopterus natalensis]|uniref:CD48 antigen n=1 Tax=Miniopterus natalensis TaxID=291302 RepID=UPI0007A6D5E5|nr:PREDICTED: CD48 antigen [Miniopterus natalensis]
MELARPHVALGQSERPVFQVSGKNASLQISNLPENYQRLTWFYNTTQKILQWESNEPNPRFFRTKFKDRVMLCRENGALHISDVRKEDSSNYILKVLKSGIERGWKVPLQVFDPVPRPVIKIEKAQEVNNSCYLNLSCVVQDESVKYTWYGDSGPILEKLQSRVLEITVKPQTYSRFYMCQVSNPVSNSSDTVYFTSACKLAGSSGVAWTTEWLVVMILIILSLLLT